MTVTLDASEVGRRFSELVERAEHGQTTLITHEGRVCAVLAPPPAENRVTPSMTDLRGSGHGFWGPDVEATLRSLREEWGTR
jgi:antitoxin (DNA-binding transcriptional repressor) of toxin-antitoxin stability system